MTSQFEGQSNAKLAIIIKPMSLVDVGRIARVVNDVFARDPGTTWMYTYAPRGTPEHAAQTQGTLKLRKAVLLRHIGNPNMYVVSARTDNGEIAGFSMWSPPSHLPRPVPLRFRLLRLLLQAYDAITALLYPFILQNWLQPELTERAWRRSLIVSEDASYKAKLLPEKVRQEGYWQLTALGTDECFERKGVGKKLLQWGMDKADETGHAIWVAASEAGVKLYTHCGFEILEQTILLKDEPGGSIKQTYLIRHPKAKDI